MAMILVDTNILVYAHDRGEHQKQEQANRILDELFNSGAGINPFAPNFVMDEWL